MKMTILSGLPRSGKSTYANTINAVKISRDTIREELYGTKNNMEHEEEVSKVFNERLIEVLKNKEDIVIDNTNLKCKYVQPFIELANKYNYEVLIIRFFTDFITLWKRAEESNFPIGVINRMASSQEMWKFERFGVEIKDIVIKEHTIQDLELLMDNFNQHNPHHTDDLLTHSKKVAEYVIKNEVYKDINIFYKDKLYTTFLLHDIGKLMAVDKSEDIWTYYGHERASWYIGKCYYEKGWDSMYPELMLVHMDKFKLKNGMKINKWLHEVYEIWKTISDFNLFKDFLNGIYNLWIADSICHENADIKWLEDLIEEIKEHSIQFMRNKSFSDLEKVI